MWRSPNLNTTTSNESSGTLVPSVWRIPPSIFSDLTYVIRDFHLRVVYFLNFDSICICMSIYVSMFVGYLHTLFSRRHKNRRHKYTLSCGEAAAS